MTDDLHMLYDPRTGRMLAIGSKQEVREVSEAYMENLRMLMEMMEAEKAHKSVLTF